MISARVGEQSNLELDDLFVNIGHRFGRVELRRRMRDYVRGLLAPVARKNRWQLAEQAGHATPDGLQHLLAGAKWNPADIRDDLQEHAADKVGENDGVLTWRSGSAEAGSTVLGPPLAPAPVAQPYGLPTLWHPIVQVRPHPTCFPWPRPGTVGCRTDRATGGPLECW
ncbi:transposase [Streptomyces sp. NBC_00122]|uniref:transposase n=1 Tax=Streptomyces sp. NBC_00122 TaxID=2903623 RepID=UPI003254DF7C